MFLFSDHQFDVLSLLRLCTHDDRQSRERTHMNVMSNTLLVHSSDHLNSEIINGILVYTDLSSTCVFMCVPYSRVCQCVCCMLA